MFDLQGNYALGLNEDGILQARAMHAAAEHAVLLYERMLNAEIK